MKTSLLIPAIPGHFRYLPIILQLYLDGSMQPDEVVISLSESDFVPFEQKEAFTKEFCSRFDNFIFLEEPSKLWHGPNRQKAGEASSNEILIYQDADDIPHPQRIEVIKYFFDKFDIFHLNHCWISYKKEFKKINDFAQIRAIMSDELFKSCFPKGHFKDCVNVTKAYGENFSMINDGVHSGAVSVRREVLDKVKWKMYHEFQLCIAEDYEFNMGVLFKFNKSIIIDCGLYQFTSLDLDLDLDIFLNSLQIKGFFYILPNEITDAFENKPFTDQFLKYLYNEEQDLKRELIKQMQDKELADDISDHLKERFIKVAITFFQYGYKRGD